MGSYLGRFVVPLLLLAAAVVAWLIAAQLGSAEENHGDADAAGAGTTTTLDTPLASIERLPDFVTSTARADALELALLALPTDPGGLSCSTVYLDGQPVLEMRSDRALVPAYAQMLITAHAAIDVLGPDYRYETQVFADALPDLNGRLFNGVYLIGGGDPGLMSYLYSRSFRPIRTTRTAIEDLAQAVADAGVVRIDGGVIAVERRFDTERTLPGWPDEYLTQGVIGPLTALQLDDGFAERASANGGVAVPADDPARLAADRFGDQLRGIDVQVFGESQTFAADGDLPELVPVARVFSPPLADIVLQTLAVNDASAAELILKEVGVVAAGTGTTQAGARAVQELLGVQGVDVAVPFRDASGLDPIGGTSCDQLARAADSIPDDHPTLNSLPAHDLPSVFDGRLVDSELLADLRLVGGVHNDASGIVGRTVGSDPRVSIASIVNRAGGPNDVDLAYQTALVELVDALQAAVNVGAVATE